MEDTGKNVFITGKAGTGKSTLLEYFRTRTKKRVVVLAPTGVAALNVRGETLHSFFRFKPDITVQKVRRVRSTLRRIYQELDAIVIDEVSMVRADLLDCVDLFLRLNGRSSTLPFGGIQMMFIGDLYQLPPVVTSQERPIFTQHYPGPYFFDAQVFADLPLEFVELKKVYRQQDEGFIALLNRIRNNTVTESDLRLLNRRVGVSFPQKEGEFVVCLTTINRTALTLNQENLRRLPGKTYEYRARVEGEFDAHSYPTDYHLKVKVGAQVMMLNNDKEGRWVNGSLGRITGVSYDPDEDGDVIMVQFQDGRLAPVKPFQWEIFRFRYQPATKTIESETVGTFTQYPLKLAWAVTIHKSQGKQFDRVIIDLSRGTFATGQVYVALSRCTSLAGIALKRPLRKSDIFTDWRIVKFLTRFQDQLSEPADY